MKKQDNNIIFHENNFMFCSYITGKCFNKRAMKKDGNLHTLCEYHRQKQNEAQKKSDLKHYEKLKINRANRNRRAKLLLKRFIQNSEMKSTKSIINDNVKSVNKCCYLTGKCYNECAIKKNDQLHKLCEYHRQKQNKTQKKSDLHRKGSTETTTTKFHLEVLHTTHQYKQHEHETNRFSIDKIKIEYLSS